MTNLIQKSEYHFPDTVSDEEKTVWIGYAIGKIEANKDESAKDLLNSLDWDSKQKVLIQLGAFARERKNGKLP